MYNRHTGAMPRIRLLRLQRVECESMISNRRNVKFYNTPMQNEYVH